MLGDKANYDSSLHELMDGLNQSEIERLTGHNAKAEQPLESLVKQALNYDSV